MFKGSGTWYGEANSQKLARKQGEMLARSRMALRNADNIGYYAIDLDMNLLSYA